MRENNSQGNANQIIEEQDFEDSIKQSVRESLNSMNSKKEQSDNIIEQVDAYKVLVKKLLLGLKLSVTNLNIFVEIPEQSGQQNQTQNEKKYLLCHLESFSLQQFHDKQESKSFIKQALFSNFEAKAHGLQLYLTSKSEIPQNDIESSECILCCGHEYEYNAQLNQCIPKQQMRISLQKQNIQAIFPRLEIMLDTKQINMLLILIRSIQQFKQDEINTELVFQNQQIQTEKITQASKIQAAAAPPRMRVYSFDYQEMNNQIPKKGKLLELKKRKSSQKQAHKKSFEKSSIKSGSKEQNPLSKSQSDISESEQIIGNAHDNIKEDLDGWSDIDLDVEEEEIEKEIKEQDELDEKLNNQKDEEYEEEEEIQNENQEDELSQPSKIIEDYFTQQFKKKIQDQAANKLQNIQDNTSESEADVSAIKQENQQSDDEAQLCKDLFETLQFNDSQLSEILESMRQNEIQQMKGDQQQANQNIYGASQQARLDSSILVKEEIKNLNNEAIGGIKQDSSHHFLLQSIHIYLIKNNENNQIEEEERKWIYSKKRSGDERLQSKVKFNIYMKGRNLFQMNITGINIVQYKDEGNSLHLYFRKAKIFDLNWVKVDPNLKEQKEQLTKTRQRKYSSDNISYNHFCINQILSFTTMVSKKQSSTHISQELEYSIRKNRIENTHFQSQSKVCFNLLSNNQKKSILLEISMINFNGDYITLLDLYQFCSDIKIEELNNKDILKDASSRNNKQDSSSSSALYEVNHKNISGQMKCGDYDKEEQEKKQSESDQIKSNTSKLSIQIENITCHYQIIHSHLLKEINSNTKSNSLINQTCYCTSKLKYQRLNKCPSLLVEFDQLKIIQTINRYQTASNDYSLLPFYSILRNELNFNELQISMLKDNSKSVFIDIIGDKNLSCDPFICIETINKEYQSKYEESPTINHQESFQSFVQDADYLNTPFNRIRQNSNLLLFNTNPQINFQNHKPKNKEESSEGLFFKKDKLFIFNVDEEPIKNLKSERQQDQSRQYSSSFNCQATFSTQILISLPVVSIEIKKESIENLILLLYLTHTESNMWGNCKSASPSSLNAFSQDEFKDKLDDEKKEFIINIYTNTLTLTYHTSSKDQIILEINSLQAKYDVVEQQLKCSIYDIIIIDTQQAKPILGQPLRLVENTKIASKYRQYQVQDFILYKQGVYTQHQQFSLGKQPIRVSIHRILSTSSDEEKMNSSYYFPQRMIMIPKSHDQSDKMAEDDRHDQSDWIIKFKYDIKNEEYSLKLFGCVFRLTDFSLPFLDEIQFLLENIVDMVKQIDEQRSIDKKSLGQMQEQGQKNQSLQISNLNVDIQNSAIDIFMYYNQNYLEKGGLSRMSFSHQVIDLELKKNDYYSNNRLCLLIPDCSFSIEQSNQIQDGKQPNMNQNNTNQQLVGQENKINVKVSGYLQQLSGYFLQFEDHCERLNSVLLLDYSTSIVLMPEESLLKQMNFKQIFNIHSIGINTNISNQQSIVQIQARGIQFLLCKDTMKYLINFHHLLEYNIEILGGSENRRKKIAEQYLRMQQEKQNQGRKLSNKSLQHPFFEIIEDEIENQQSQSEIKESSQSPNDDKQQKDGLQEGKEDKKQSIASIKNKRNNFTSSRSIFRTHNRLINMLEEEDMNILETEKTFFNQEAYEYNENSNQQQDNTSISFSFQLDIDDFYINIFKGLDFNYDVTYSLDNTYRDPLKRNMRNQPNFSSSNNPSTFLSNSKIPISPRKSQTQIELSAPPNRFRSLKQSQIFKIAENYMPQNQKFEIKREEYRILQKENVRDYKNRMQVVVKGASFKTEEYIQLSQQGNLVQNLQNNQLNQQQIKKKIFFSMKKFEIIDDLKQSSIKKFLTQKKKKVQIQNSQQQFINQLMTSSSMNFSNLQNSHISQNINMDVELHHEIEQETGIDFMNLEIQVLEESTEHIRVQGGLKIHPLQLYIHGVTLDFLIDFFDLKNEIQQALSGKNKKPNSKTQSRSTSPTKRKGSLKKGSKSKQQIIKNEWEILEGEDEAQSQQNVNNELEDVEQYDHYESSEGSSDEENKELIFDNNISLLKFYYEKNNINHISPKKGRGIFSGIEDINPFQQYKNKYSFETFDTKKQQNISQNNNDTKLNKSSIEFTSTKANKNRQSQVTLEFQKAEGLSTNQEIGSNIQQISKEIKLLNKKQTQESGMESELNIINQESNSQDEQIKNSKEKHQDSDNQMEDEDFDEELDNMSFSSIQTNSQKYRIEVDNFEIQNTEISLDYDPRAIDLFQLMNNFKMEALNLSSIKGINFSLPNLYITKKNFSNLMNIIQISINTYQKDILENQFSYLDIAQKVNLLNSVSKIFSSMADIVTVPFERYQAQETVVEGTLEGTKTVAKMISYQALDISSTILSTVHSTFNLFGIKSRPTRFLTKVLHSIRRQVEEDEEKKDFDEKYKSNSNQK